MKNATLYIPVLNLLWMVIPVSVVVVILMRWSHKLTNTLHAIARMVVQLVLVGYLLSYIFETDRIWIVLLVLTVMGLAASYISLRMVPHYRKELMGYALISILVGSISLLILVTQGVLQLTPWYNAQFMIPLAGMIFANSMNSISLASERFFAERERDVPYLKARSIAYKAALIPNVNAFFAVGLVSLPGMMTGQILSGISPLIAVRYQIMVMCMVFASAGISAACFLYFLKKKEY